MELYTSRFPTKSGVIQIKPAPLLLGMAERIHVTSRAYVHRTAKMTLKLFCSYRTA
jgi:hypothetical protein